VGFYFLVEVSAKDDWGVVEAIVELEDQAMYMIPPYLPSLSLGVCWEVSIDVEETLIIAPRDLDDERVFDMTFDFLA
jgi:hypothetical protein